MGGMGLYFKDTKVLVITLTDRRRGNESNSLTVPGQCSQTRLTPYSTAIFLKCSAHLS